MTTRSTRRALSAALVCLALAAPVLEAQQPSPAAAPAAALTAPAVGSVAPDFALPGATRYGVLDAPVRLSDYRGETVVLAFFFKARTKG